MTGVTAKIEIATILGWTAAITSAIGVILGGMVSDWWRQRDPRGRVFVNMLAVVLPAPAVWVIYSTDDLATFYLVNPIATTLGAAWVGAAVATLQDFVLPRMRATAGATYVLGTTLIGLALGPYFAGKMALVTGSLRSGVLSLFVMAPVTLLLLWIVSRRMAEVEGSKVERARAAGEPIGG
jgi:MFS family permease